VSVFWGVLARGLIIRGGVGHSEIGADHIDDGLPLVRVLLRQPFQRVQPAEPHRGLLPAELIDRTGVQLGDALLGGVSLGGCGDLALVLQGLLGGPLPAGGQQQCNGATGGDRDSASGAYRIQLHAGLSAAIEPPQHNHGCHSDPQHKHGPQHDRPSRQGPR